MKWVSHISIDLTTRCKDSVIIIELLTDLVNTTLSAGRAARAAVPGAGAHWARWWRWRPGAGSCGRCGAAARMTPMPKVGQAPC